MPREIEHEYLNPDLRPVANFPGGIALKDSPKRHSKDRPRCASNAGSPRLTSRERLLLESEPRGGHCRVLRESSEPAHPTMFKKLSEGPSVAGPSVVGLTSRV